MKITNLISLLFLSLFFTSCQKVIKIDLNSSNPALVVEGNVTDQPGPYTVMLTNSVNYYQSNVFPPVTGATVTISDNEGNSETLKEVTPGIYNTSTLQGVPGRTYHLQILTGGKEYDAVSIMPSPVPVDSFNVDTTNKSFFGGRNSGQRLICKFKDPAGGGLHYYKLQLTATDTSGFNGNSIRVLSDKLTNGDELSITYRTHLMRGDTVTADLESIDLGTYNFFNTFQNVVGETNPFFSALPANPISNISNNGFGYFSAHSVTTKTTVIP